MKSTKTERIIPGWRVSAGITITMLTVLVLIPLASVLVSSLSLGVSGFFEVLLDDAVLWAFATSIGMAFAAALINSVFGLLLAWVIVRYDFPLRRILDGMIELPFCLPTAVAGITLSKMYSTSGALGSLLAKFGIEVSYTHLGILTALVFIGIPFTARAVIPVLESLSPAYEEAAYILGAGRLTSFMRVVLPELMPALLAGFGLAFARGVGEYGSVIYIAGNSAKEHTQVISYLIMQKLNYLDYPAATAIALAMLVISFVILLGINLSGIYQARRTAGVDESAGRGSVRGRRRPKGGEWILVIISAVFIFVMLMLPLFSVISNALSKGLSYYWSSLTAEYVKSAFAVTVLVTVITLAVNTVFGLAASWMLTRFDFRGKNILSTLIDIPFSVSPVIAGLSYLMMFGRLGWAYPMLEYLNRLLGTDIKIVFALPGVVLATIFVTFPFVSRELIPVMNVAGRGEEEAAALMGAKGWTIFRRITFPHIKWALIYGMILCAARALGEFGAVNALSKTRGETFTLSLEIDALYLAGDPDQIVSAFAVSSILVLIAVAVLVARNILEYRDRRQMTEKNEL